MAVRHAGPTVAAGVILAGTFASLTLAGNAVLSQMGFAISFGIAVAAFIMEMFFTPPSPEHAAWRPGHGDRTQTASGVGIPEPREPERLTADAQ